MVVPSWIMVEMLIERYAMRYHFTTFPIHDINGRALVFEGDHLVGIVSPSDVARRLQLGELRSEPPRLAA